MNYAEDAILKEWLKLNAGMGERTVCECSQCERTTVDDTLYTNADGHTVISDSKLDMLVDAIRYELFKPYMHNSAYLNHLEHQYGAWDCETVIAIEKDLLKTYVIGTYPSTGIKYIPGVQESTPAIEAAIVAKSTTGCQEHNVLLNYAVDLTNNNVHIFAWDLTKKRNKQ